MIAWLQGKLCGAAAIALAGLLLWQTARIEGWPLVGGGFRAQVGALQAEAAARLLAGAQAHTAALTEAARRRDAVEQVAMLHADTDRRIETQIRTVIRKVPIHVTGKNDRECVVPVGAVRLLDAAASGAAFSDAAARIAPGQPDDAASDVALSEIVALLAENAGIARRNAQQLTALQHVQP